MRASCNHRPDHQYDPLLRRTYHLFSLVETPMPPEDYEHLPYNQVGPNVDAIVETWKCHYYVLDADL